MCELMKYTRLKIISSSLIIQKYKLFFIGPDRLCTSPIHWIYNRTHFEFYRCAPHPLQSVNRIGSHISQVDLKINRWLNFDGNFVYLWNIVSASNLKSSSIQTRSKFSRTEVICKQWDFMTWKIKSEWRDAENRMNRPKIEIDIVRMLKCLWPK